MALTRWNPFGTVDRWDASRGLGDIQGEMNRLFENFAGRQSNSNSAMWWPAVDVHETQDDVVLRFEIPGVNEKDIHLSITGDVLTVRGERRFERDDTTETYHRVERAYGKFERSVHLSMRVQTDKVSASYRDGVLEVKLPKSEELKPREIKIDMMS
jgi:HSP20 family protein